MFEDVLGDWPTHDRFILVSCDEKYLNKYFPRFYKTFTQHWQLPIHAHVIDPSDLSLDRLKRLGVSHTWCLTKQHDWSAEITKYRATHKTKHPDSEVKTWLYECYCQCQRFVLLANKMIVPQSVIVVDVDAYAQIQPSTADTNFLYRRTSFTEHNSRLMATLCHFHCMDIDKIKEMGKLITNQLRQEFVVGMDQKAIKNIFGDKQNLNILGNRWVRHHDAKTPEAIAAHHWCLIYHEKGVRGKDKGPKVKWTDIE